MLLMTPKLEMIRDDFIKHGNCIYCNSEENLIFRRMKTYPFSRGISSIVTQRGKETTLFIAIENSIVVCKKCNQMINHRGEDFYHEDMITGFEHKKKMDRLYHSKNKEHYNELSKEHKQKLNQWYHELKDNKACEVCNLPGDNGKNYLTYHHLDPSIKFMNVSEMVNRCLSKERILEEISKCILLCENCHRKNHIKENKRNTIRTWYVNFKKELVCESCGENDWRCLEFHHINSDTKIENVATMVNNCAPLEDICDEIAKCRCYCANCHRNV